MKTSDTPAADMNDGKIHAHFPGNCVKIIIFILIFILLLNLLGVLFQPVWTTWNITNTISSFYDEPENTIEVLFLGSSAEASGIIPAELYEDYGICAYNLGTPNQPLLISCYWTEEVYHYHSESLTTVVLDVSMLKGDSDESDYRWGLDDMKLSMIKIRAALDYANGDLNDAINFLIPLFSYHERWTELEEIDFTDFLYESEPEYRGYFFLTEDMFDALLDPDDPDYSYTMEFWEVIQDKTSVLDQEEQAISLDTTSLYYFDQLIQFCQSHDIQLVLTRSPSYIWDSSYHNAVQNLADSYGLTFLDFNFNPLFDEVGYNYASDSTDGAHSNYYGAHKLTAYMGQWLTDNASVTDVRNDPNYNYMEDSLEEYHASVSDIIELIDASDPTEYITAAMENEDNEIYLMVNDSATNEMTDAQREWFLENGLSVLSELTYQSAYLGIIRNGTVEYEATDSFDAEQYEAVMNTIESMDPDEAACWISYYSPLEYNGVTGDSFSLSLRSGGAKTGGVASCVIDGIECSMQNRGLNIVVYSTELHSVVDSAVFDLHQSSIRESNSLEAALKDALQNETKWENYSDDLKEYYLYCRQLELSSLASTTNNTFGPNGLLGYLQTYMEVEDVAIFLSAKGDSSVTLTGEAREYLANLGLTELSDIDGQDSYIGFILNGEIVYEGTGQSGDSIAYNNLMYTIVSSGLIDGGTSSIEINGVEYSPNQSGINIVVYDTRCGTVFNTRNFDTSSTAQSIPE